MATEGTLATLRPAHPDDPGLIHRTDRKVLDSAYFEERAVRVTFEGDDFHSVLSQDLDDLRRRTVATADPHHLRRVTADETMLMKVGVLRDDRERVLCGVIPYQGIVCTSEADITDVGGIRIQVGK